MKARTLTTAKVTLLALALVSILSLTVVHASGTEHLATYRVTIINLNSGQPLSPPVAATHKPKAGVFSVGRLASPELEAISEDGNQMPLYDLLRNSPRVTEAVNVGVPLTPWGQVVGDFQDSVFFEISARPGDRLSLATMLICTNDGFAGLNRVRLPARVQRIFPLWGYDAGTEHNTEMSGDIVDACSALGPLPLNGDPNGNEDASVDTAPPRRIRLHGGIRGKGDLSVNDHGWRGPTGVVIVERID